MPSPKQHDFQAKHNCELLEFLKTSNKRDYFRDWYVTIAFYTALHYFEAILHTVSRVANKRRSSKAIPIKADYYDHGERLTIMRNEIFCNVYKPYYELYAFSRIAKYNRYETTEYTTLQADKKLKEVRTECLKVKARYDKLGKAD